MTTQTEALKLALEALARIDLWLQTRYSGVGLVGIELQAVTAIQEALAQPEQCTGCEVMSNMSEKTIYQAYGELREIIDGGSESFTHEDAVQYLKDKLAQPNLEKIADDLPEYCEKYMGWA